MPVRLQEVTSSWKGMQHTRGRVGTHGDTPEVGLQIQAAPLSKENSYSYLTDGLQFAQLGSESMHTSLTGLGLGEIIREGSRLLQSEGVLLKGRF